MDSYDDPFNISEAFIELTTGTLYLVAILAVVFSLVLFGYSFKVLLYGNSGIKYKKLQKFQKQDRWNRFMVFILVSVFGIALGIMFFVALVLN